MLSILCRRSVISTTLISTIIAIGVMLFLSGGCGSEEDPSPLGCELALVSPDGGETYAVGDTTLITWSGSNACGALRILLLRGTQQCTIADNVPNTGEYEWIVAPCIPDSLGQHKIGLLVVNENTYDESEAPFTIHAAAAPCDLEVIYPNGGEAIELNDSIEIKWNASPGCTDEVMIELRREGTPCDTLASATENDGAFSWIAQQCSGQSLNYEIRVSAGEASDVSDAPFAISSPSEPCSLTLNSPNGGEEWTAGTSYAIAWEYSGDCDQSLTIDLLNDGDPCATVTASVGIDSSPYNWVATQCDGQTLNYEIRISAGETDDTSDAPFAINLAPTECNLLLVAPNGGELWMHGALQAIEWEHSGDCGETVMIVLWSGDSPCDTLATALAIDASPFSWAATMCYEEFEGYRVRIHAGEVSDASDGTFSISLGSTR